MSALSRVSRTEGDKLHTVPLLMESKMRHKMGFLRQAATHAERTGSWLPRGSVAGAVDWELEISRHKLVYREVDE